MKDIIVILPSLHIEEVDLKSSFNAIFREFGELSNFIVLTYDDTSHSYYKKQLDFLDISVVPFFKKGAFLSKELLFKVYNKAFKMDDYRVVILRDMDNNISIPYKDDVDINIYMWSALNNRIRSIKDEVSIEEDVEIESNIFSKIAKHHRSQYVLTPYGYTLRHSGYGYINEFGFRVPKDYQKLKNRRKNHKLICFFGNSSCFSMRVRDKELFTNLLEKKLNNYYYDNNINQQVTVLNFGMMGHLVLNEIYTYIAFAQELNPDMVFAHHLINDLASGMTNDNLLLKKFHFSYSYFFEEWSLKLHKNDIILRDKIPTRNKINSSQDIINSYYARDNQFKDLIKNNGSRYVSIIQPVSFSKKELSEREKKV